jgi:quinoprotein glucose dehydrogenase
MSTVGLCRALQLLSKVVLLATLASACSQPQNPDAGPAQRRVATEWPSYGNDPGGQRYVVLDQLTKSNVDRLRVAWTFHVGDYSNGKGEIASTSAFEATPILVDGVLYVCSPFNRVFAIDPQSGAAHWTFDPHVDVKSGRYANQLICRGVSYWRDARASDSQPCTRRIFTATNDARLIAIDAASGQPCKEFGDAGQVDLNPGAGKQLWKGEYQVTSPPAVIGDRVVVGSAVSDNARIDAPSGVVRAFDARSGRLSWAWDLAPPDFERRPDNTSKDGYALGTPNVWAPIAVDAERDLVFVPTGNAAPDYYHGERAFMNYYGSSVVALRGVTGEVAWHYQTVHNDLWDYDVPAQPMLTTIRHDGADVPVVIQATKMGMLFILNRDTGKPVLPIEERAVPQNGAPGEHLSPTQPFTLKPQPLVPHSLTAEDAWGLTFWDRGKCKELFQTMRLDGIYTPPTLQGSVMYPGNAGGSNWGGIAVHPQRHIAVANVMNLPFFVRLVPHDELAAERERYPHDEISPQTGTPYGIHRLAGLSPLGLPCNKPPWGMLAAIDMDEGRILWEEPIGTTRDIAPFGISIRYGVPNIGGPLVTSSGLIFLGATLDNYLRAIDLDTGAELWKGRLPAGGQATPMAYTIGNKPYVVIAAGGHARAGTKLGDSVVAFTLPD